MKYLIFLLIILLLIYTGCNIDNKNTNIINNSEFDHQSVFFDNNTKNDFIETISTV